MSEKGPRLKKLRDIVPLSLLNKVETVIFKSGDICLVPTCFSHAVHPAVLFQSWKPVWFPHPVFALKRMVLFSFFFFVFTLIFILIFLSVQLLHPRGPIPFLRLLSN